MKNDLAERPAASERILNTAVALFYAEGIHAVGVDRVVAESGVAKATLYQQFGSKDALVAAYLKRHADQWESQVARPALAVTGSTARRVGAVFEFLGRTFAAPDFRGCAFINAAAEYPHQHGSVAAAIASHRADVYNLFVTLLADLPPASRAGRAAELVLLYDGAIVSAQLDAGAQVAKTAQKAARRLVQSAVRRRPAADS